MSKIGATKSQDKPDGKGNDKPKPLEKRFRHHWRIDMLAVPKGRTEELEMFKMSPGEKEQYLKDKASKVSIKKPKNRLEDPAFNKRMKELAYYPARFYVSQKKLFKDLLGAKFEMKMDKKIKGYTHTSYYEYKKAKKIYAKKQKAKARAKSREKRAAKGKKEITKEDPKKRKERKIKAAIEHCISLAKPKGIHYPPKIDRGKRLQIDEIMTHLQLMAKAKHTYVKPEDDPSNPINMNKIKPGALKYKPSARIFDLATPASHRLAKEDIPVPGTVKRAALKAVASPRLTELSVPRARAAANDADFNEDAFKISPAALKYVATPRIQELAEPIERE